MRTEMALFALSFGAYVMAFVGFTGASVLVRRGFQTFGRVLFYLGAFLAWAGLGVRWYEAGYPPLSNMFESMMTLSAFFALISILFTLKKTYPLLEAGMAAVAVLLSGLGASFSPDLRSLPPVLQSGWMHLHVSLAFLGDACFALSFLLCFFYAARRLIEDEKDLPRGRKEAGLTGLERLFCGGIVFGAPLGFLALMVLVLNRLARIPAKAVQFQVLLGGVAAPFLVAIGVFYLTFFLLRGAGKTADQWLPSSLRLEEMNFQAIALGYPLYVTGAILFGMLWANNAWGRYWGWDPKETWALITFLTYSIYLHLRLLKGWRSIHAILLSIVGFVFAFFTIFGVNFLLSGLHSYAM